MTRTALAIAAAVIGITSGNVRGIPEVEGKYYSSCGRVIQIERQSDDTDLVSFTDGHDIWRFLTDASDYEIRDGISVIFREAGRPNYIYDDEIVEARYTPQDITGQW